VDFSSALTAARDGRRVRREAWADLDGRAGLWMEIRFIPGLGAVMTCPLPGGGLILFACSQWDILAEDWEILS
jgi:hypothetical protein